MLRVLSNVNIAGMSRFLEDRFPGRPIEFAPYDQVAQELLDPSSPLWSGNSKLALIYLEGFRVFGQDCAETCEFAQAVDIAETRLREVLEPIEAYLQVNPDRCVLINTLAYPMSSGRNSLDRNIRFQTAMVDAFNLGLTRWRSEHRDVRLVICDWAACAARFGSANIYDERLWYVGRMPLNARGQEELAALYARAARSLSGRNKKVLVVDLDNTIWGGVIGEDGARGIALGEDGLGKVYRDFQTQLRRLRRRGVLLTIASKNNEDDVDRVFSDHPMMVLNNDDFVSRKIGWGPKPEAIAQLSKELALGLDSFVFVDDSPAERGLVRHALPDVSVPEFPEDPYTINSWFQSVTSEHYDTLLLTGEDKQRTEIYRADIRRNEDRTRSTDLETYYRDLQMEMRVWTDHREQIERIAQLTQKTNQFNLSARRYDVSDIEGFVAAPDVRVYDAELADRYGSNGIVGVVITKIKGEAAEIDTFLLSCRVIGRNVEKALFAFVADDLAKAGVKEITAEYIPTSKNAPAEGLLDQLDFEAGEGPRIFKVRTVKSPDYILVKRSVQ